MLNRLLEHVFFFKIIIEFPFVVVLQIGIVSDDELLDLLDLALSSDTSNTVIRARELMRSRIDPMQLISQLANLIMDILAGKSQEGSSELRRKFSSRHTCKFIILYKLLYEPCLVFRFPIDGSYQNICNGYKLLQEFLICHIRLTG